MGARVQSLLGIALVQRGDLEEAEALLETALATQTANDASAALIAVTSEALEGLR